MNGLGNDPGRSCAPASGGTAIAMRLPDPSRRFHFLPKLAVFPENLSEHMFSGFSFSAFFPKCEVSLRSTLTRL